LESFNSKLSIERKYFPQIFAEKVADDRRLFFIIRVNQRLKSS